MRSATAPSTSAGPATRRSRARSGAIRTMCARNSRSRVAHSIDTVAAFIADRVADDALVIVLGDHQPAPIITGPDASRAVPVHIFSRDETVLEPFSDLGFVTGAVPPPAPEGGDGAIPAMEAFRPFMLEAFSSGPPPAQAMR